MARAVAGDAHRGRRQPRARHRRRAQGRRAPGVERLARHRDDRAVVRPPRPGGPGGGQAARLARLPRDPVPARRAGPVVPDAAAGAGRAPVVQRALAKILNAIYEQDFLDCSFGFRPNRSCHDALKILNVYVEKRNTNYVVDADIKGFFDNVDHQWLMTFLKHRINDPSLLRIIVRFLKAGYMEEGKYFDTEKGTPQGGVVSPILANVYLHYVLDLWFEKSC